MAISESLSTSQHCATITHTILTHPWFDTWVQPWPIKVFPFMQRMGNAHLDSSKGGLTIMVDAARRGDDVGLPMDIDPTGASLVV